MMACAFEMRIGPHVAAPIALYGLEGLDRCYEKLPIIQRVALLYVVRQRSLYGSMGRQPTC